MTVFADRRDAGRALAERLSSYADRDDLLVLGLPRGGVPVAYEVARAMGAPLDVLVVRKLGAPGREELAMGAIAGGGVRVLYDDVVSTLGVPGDVIDRVAERERDELRRREELYRGTDRPLDVTGRTVIVVDDGLATGSTMRAAIRWVRAHEPRIAVAAVPTGAAEACAKLREEADDVVCATVPEPFYAVGMYYRNFDQTTDAEVRELLSASTAGR